MQELSGSTPSANLISGGVDEIFQRTDSSGAYSFLADALGSTLALTNGSGSLATQYTYAPFGATTTSGSSTNSFQYTGRENDGTGLYYYRARYYNTQIGRFISEDPLTFAGDGVNFYAYVSDDPVDQTDPLGLCSKKFERQHNDKPNVPPDWDDCKKYRDGSGAGDSLYQLCMKFPDNPWSNCVRGRLLQQYVPNGSPLDLSKYLFWDHPLDFASCAN